MARSTLKCVLLCIIGCELCERLAYYSLSGNLTLFMRKNLAIATEESAILISCWIGFMYTCAVLLGFIADRYLNRYRTILVSGSLYFVGLLAIMLLAIVLEHRTTTAVQSPDHSTELLLCAALALVGIGAGGIKSTVGPFGADQFKCALLQSTSELRQKSYWSWFYFAINIGSLIAFTVVSYVCQNVSFTVGYSIPSACLLVAMCVFYTSRHRYFILPPSHNDETAVQSTSANDDAQRIRQIFVFCALEVMYWTVYCMQSTLFLSQACQMNVDWHGFEIPIASLDVANILVILVLIPCMDWLVYPRLKNKWTILQQIGTGMAVVVLALVCAAGVEIMRKRSISTTMASPCDPLLMVSELSVLWQIPQYLLIGVAEVLTVINSYNLFFTEAPPSHKSMTYALNFVSYALGSCLQTALLVIVNAAGKWIENDLNRSKLENYFLLCALLLSVDVVAFILYARTYQYKNIRYVQHHKTMSVSYSGSRR